MVGLSGFSLGSDFSKVAPSPTCGIFLRMSSMAVEVAMKDEVSRVALQEMAGSRICVTERL